MSAEDVFEQSRSVLTRLCYQMLGSWADAEDVVQGTWLKWQKHCDDVQSPRAWLTRVAVRGSIDSLRARQGRAEHYPGEWLPEPVSTDPGPDDVVVEHGAVSMGVLVMMESLSPLERAVFVLRRAFSWSYDEIAAVLDRRPEAVRQLDHRARAHLEARSERFVPDPDRVQVATERFLSACLGGSIESMMEVLAPDVVLHSDGGGQAKAPRRQIHGSMKVARFFGAILQGALAETEVHLIDVNGLPGLLARTAGEAVAVVTVDVDQSGRISDLYLVAAPAKLRSVHLPQ